MLPMFQQIAVQALENIRTVASLTKEPYFLHEYRTLTEGPYRFAYISAWKPLVCLPRWAAVVFMSPSHFLVFMSADILASLCGVLQKYKAQRHAVFEARASTDHFFFVSGL